VQPDGKVKLFYQGTPVWMFTAPLARYADDSQGHGQPGPSAAPTGCSYVYIVDATAGTLLTDWQSCAGR
jgi:hypothetical protein